MPICFAKRQKARTTTLARDRHADFCDDTCHMYMPGVCWEQRTGQGDYAATAAEHGFRADDQQTRSTSDSPQHNRRRTAGSMARVQPYDADRLRAWLISRCQAWTSLGSHSSTLSSSRGRHRKPLPERFASVPRNCLSYSAGPHRPTWCPPRTPASACL